MSFSNASGGGIRRLMVVATVLVRVLAAARSRLRWASSAAKSAVAGWFIALVAGCLREVDWQRHHRGQSRGERFALFAPWVFVEGKACDACNDDDNGYVKSYEACEEDEA